MKAMILAAGFGTRLQPLTNDRPKALVEVGGVTLLEIMIKKLIDHGFTDIIVNVHHFADQIIEFLENHNNFDINIKISDERAELLNTGGGIAKAKWFFNDNKDFLVINVDVLTDLDLSTFMDIHHKNEAMVTLAVRNRATSRYFLFDDDMRLCGWKNNKSSEKRVVRDEDKNLTSLAFSGIHVINPRIFSLMENEGSFSIVDVYLDLAKDNKIFGFKHDETFWMDVGKKENLDEGADFVRMTMNDIKHFKKHNLRN